MNKIAPDHLARDAVVYIRQSTPDQLRNNHESRRRQYGLADRARGLGWDEPVVIDEDLGRSGGGTSRPGFERLLVSICEGRVGIVLSLEASRARSETAVTGTRCWSSARLWAVCWATMTACTILACRTTGCCSV